MNQHQKRTLIFAPLILAGLLVCEDSYGEPLSIASDGWQLRADLQSSNLEDTQALAVLLHKASGNRSVYEQLANELAAVGIASLRVDLRGHGESTNLGVFDPTISRYMDESDPAIVANFSLIRAGDQDIASVMHWLDKQPALSELPLVVVGSSYTGEEMVEAASRTRFADAYVALAPGSFSESSIAQVDASGVPWLFVRAEVELPFFPALFDAIRQGSESAEIWVLPGKGHATDLLLENPSLSGELVSWIEKALEE